MHEANFRSMITLLVNGFGKTAINEEIDVQETRDLLSAQETSEDTNANTMCRERRLEGTFAVHATQITWRRR